MAFFSDINQLAYKPDYLDKKIDWFEQIACQRLRNTCLGKKLIKNCLSGQTFALGDEARMERKRFG
jgi:hypothetical protein